MRISQPVGALFARMHTSSRIFTGFLLAMLALPSMPASAFAQSTEVPVADCEQAALDFINGERQAAELKPLTRDPLAAQMAAAQADYLCKGNCLSHLNTAGENPDQRYTKCGGTDCLNESIAADSSFDAQTPDSVLVPAMMQQMLSHQDDLESLMSPDATGFGFTIARHGGRAVACAEVTTKHGSMQAVPEKLVVGSRIEISGAVAPPYRFDKITLAWEGTAPPTEQANAPSAPDEQTDTQTAMEEVPYFPPIDYTAYLRKVHHDHRKLYGGLKLAAIVGVIAGNFFVPGLAVAAPLIMLIPVGKKGVQEAADMPLHGGVKVAGSTFDDRIPITNQGKPGLYYLTVWATNQYHLPVAISRRVILAEGQL